MKGPVRDTLLSAGLVDLIGKENFYWELHDAVVYGQRQLEISHGHASPESKTHLRQRRRRMRVRHR